MTTPLLAPAGTLSIYRGATVSLDITVVNADGTPYALTGAVLHWTLKRQACDPQPLVHKDSGSIGGVTITDVLGGLATIALSAAETEALDPRKYTYDLWAVRTSPLVRVPLISPSVLEVLVPVTQF